MDVEEMMQRIGGYVSNIGGLRDLLLEIAPLSHEQAIARVEDLMPGAEGTWKTDLKILRNAMEEQRH